METGDIDFNDILQQASQLTAEIESTSELPRVQRNLRQVLEAGQQLLERTTRDGPRIDADTKAAVFLGTKGVDVTKLSEKLEPIYIGPAIATESHEPVSDVDLENFLKNERMNAMCAIVESTSANILQDIQDKIWMKLDSEWKLEKEEIISSLSGSLKSLQYEKVMCDYKPDVLTVLSQTELTYAHEISQYNSAVINGLPKPNLIERLQLAAKNANDRNLQELWASVVAMASSLPQESPDTLIQRRSSEHYISMMVSRAKKFLEQSFFTKLQNEVWSNLSESSIGGIPGAIQLVKSYIVLKGLDATPGLDIGAGDIGPIWLICFLLLRCGKSADAASYMRDHVCNNETSKLLEEYTKSGAHLPQETESKIRLEYRRALKNSTRDPYRKIIYCIMGGCDVEEDHKEAVYRLDDYLWLKLSVVRHNPDHRYTTDFLTYSKFQELIFEEYGEEYFEAFQQPYVYTQALILTGQFEAAIEFLSRVSGMLPHAIHVAIALNESGVLLTSDPKMPMLSATESYGPGIRALNYCRLMVSFARSLQGSNAREALNYLYLLRNIKDDKGHDLFSICVGDMVLESRDFDVFGVMNADGCKTPGLLEQMGIPSQPIILRCATESENSGLLEDAVVLYDLAGNHEQTLRVLCRVIAQNLNKPPLPDSQRERIQVIAIAYAERFQNHPPKLMKDPTLISTFYMLVDFMTFFDTVYAKQVDTALTIIQRLKVIPMEKGDVEKCKTDFHTFADEIRVNIPSLIVAAMEIIYMKYISIKSDRKSSFATNDIAKTESFLNGLKAKAQAIVTYCGMIPYFMTGDVYTKVMQIEVQMN